MHNDTHWDDTHWDSEQQTFAAARNGCAMCQDDVDDILEVRDQLDAFTAGSYDAPYDHVDDVTRAAY